MTFVHSMKLGLIFAIGACATDTEWRTASPTTVSGAEMGGGCAFGVPGTHVDTTETKGGVLMVFTARGGRVDDLRARVHRAAAAHDDGLRELQLTSMHSASVTDAEGGVKLDLVPADPADRLVLIMKARASAERMNGTLCR